MYVEKNKKAMEENASTCFRRTVDMEKVKGRKTSCGYVSLNFRAVRVGRSIQRVVEINCTFFLFFFFNFSEFFVMSFLHFTIISRCLSLLMLILEL